MKPVNTATTVLYLSLLPLNWAGARPTTNARPPSSGKSSKLAIAACGNSGQPPCPLPPVKPPAVPKSPATTNSICKGLKNPPAGDSSETCWLTPLPFRADVNLNKIVHVWLAGVDHDATNPPGCTTNCNGILQHGVDSLVAAINGNLASWHDRSFIIALTGVDGIGNCLTANVSTSDQCIQGQFATSVGLALSLVRPDTMWTAGSCSTQEFATLVPSRWKATDLGVTQIGMGPSGQFLCNGDLGDIGHN